MSDTVEAVQTDTTKNRLSQMSSPGSASTLDANVDDDCTLSTKSDVLYDEYTTIMLKNIPNKYTREMLVKELRKQGFTGQYDFLYLPTDFANDANPGYCFVDFRTNDIRKTFEKKFDGKSVQDVLPAFL